MTGPADAVVGAVAGFVSTVQKFLSAVVTTEARLLATAVVLTLGVAFALLVTPWAIGRTRRFVARRVLGDERVPEAVENATWLVPVTAAIRTLQAGILLLAGLAILVTWGRVDTAATVVLTLGGFVPTLGRVLATVALVGGIVVGTDLLETWLSAYAAESTRINEHQERLVFRVLQVVLLVAVGIAALTVWDYNVDGLLVGAGFLGIVVGMAARQTLGSLIAGFVLMFSRPFELGDWVEIDGNEGIVTDITIVNTRMRNFDGETVVFPNDRVTNATIVNRTDENRLRLRLDVGIDYGTDVERAESVALEALGSVEHVLDVPKPQVLPRSFGDSAVGLQLRYWITSPSARRRAETRAAVVRAVKRAFDREGIKIPYPQRELSGREESGGFRVARERRPVSASTSTSED